MGAVEDRLKIPHLCAGVSEREDGGKGVGAAFTRILEFAFSHLKRDVGPYLKEAQ